jgi:hypothetical protein
MDNNDNLQYLSESNELVELNNTIELNNTNQVSLENFNQNDSHKPGDSDTEDDTPSSPEDDTPSSPKPANNDKSFLTKFLLNNKLASMVATTFIDNSIKQNNPKKSADDILKFYNFFSSKKTKKLTNEEIELRVDTITKIINEIMPVFVKEMIESPKCASLMNLPSI